MNDKNIKQGWTYKNNLVHGYSISKFLSEGKISKANGALNLRTSGGKIEFLGEAFKYKPCCDYTDHRNECVKGCRGLYGVEVTPPLDINVYCLDGEIQRNQIILFEIDYGGDGGSGAIDVYTKKPLPEKECILVNGFIQETRPSAHNNQSKRCDIPIEKSRFNYEFKNGDFNYDGITEILVHETYDGAPSWDAWYLCQESNACEERIKCRISKASAP